MNAWGLMMQQPLSTKLPSLTKGASTPLYSVGPKCAPKIHWYMDTSMQAHMHQKKTLPDSVCKFVKKLAFIVAEGYISIISEMSKLYE